MSASKFCRNFLTNWQVQGARENNCHSTGEKQHQNNYPKIQKTRDFQTAARVNTEEQEHLDVPLVVVFFPESGKNHLDYRLRESTVQKKTQNIIISEHRLSTALQNADSADRGNGLSLTTGHRCNIEQKDINCSSDVAARGVSRSSYFRATNDHAFCSQADSMVTSKLPPGSTLRGLFYTKDKEKPFACAYCGKAYKGKRAVYGHIRLQHDEKRYSCGFCGKRFAQECDLSRHVTMHTKEKPFTCDQCGMRFRLRGSLRRHKYTHSEERLFPCNNCNKSFKTKENLSKHRESHITEEPRKSVICKICKRKLTNNCSLKQHMMIHTGEKPFKCSLCDKQFRLKIQLRNHMYSHSGKKRLAKPCTVCGKTVWANYLSTHMRMHTGEKPFECSICGKRFPKKINLEGHMRSHTGEKPFACGGCGKQFALYSNMVIHTTTCTGLLENLA